MFKHRWGRVLAVFGLVAVIASVAYNAGAT